MYIHQYTRSWDINGYGCCRIAYSLWLWIINLASSRNCTTFDSQAPRYSGAAFVPKARFKDAEVMLKTIRSCCYLEYIHIHVCRHLYIDKYFLYIHVHYIYVYIYIYIEIDTLIYMYTFIYIYIYMYVYIYVFFVHT